MAPFKEYGRYGSVGLELLLSMAVGYYGGRWIDGRFGGHGWLTLAGFLAGVVVGFRAIFQVGKHMQRDIERAERRDRGEDPWAEERDFDEPQRRGESSEGGGEGKSSRPSESETGSGKDGANDRGEKSS